MREGGAGDDGAAEAELPGMPWQQGQQRRSKDEQGGALAGARRSFGRSCARFSFFFSFRFSFSFSFCAEVRRRRTEGEGFVAG